MSHAENLHTSKMKDKVARSDVQTHGCGVVVGVGVSLEVYSGHCTQYTRHVPYGMKRLVEKYILQLKF